jgi:pilus assembly protein Flp/PilA
MLDYILTITGLNGRIARRDEEGASAVEYGLLVAGIAALIVAIVFLFGGMIEDVFSGTCESISTESGSGSDCGGEAPPA